MCSLGMELSNLVMVRMGTVTCAACLKHGVHDLCFALLLCLAYSCWRTRGCYNISCFCGRVKDEHS